MRKDPVKAATIPTVLLSPCPPMRLGKKVLLFLSYPLSCPFEMTATVRDLFCRPRSAFVFPFQDAFISSQLHLSLCLVLSFDLKERRGGILSSLPRSVPPIASLSTDEWTNERTYVRMSGG